MHCLTPLSAPATLSSGWRHTTCEAKATTSSCSKASRRVLPLLTKGLSHQREVSYWRRATWTDASTRTMTTPNVRRSASDCLGIMFSDNIVYPPKHSGLWADFVKVALEKKPHMRPTALQMLDHPWCAPCLQSPSNFELADCNIAII